MAGVSFASFPLVGCDREGQTLLPKMRFTSSPSWLANALVFWKPVASKLSAFDTLFSYSCC